MFEESSQGVQCLKKVWRVLSLTAALCSLKGFLLPETMTLCKNMRKLLLLKKKGKKRGEASEIAVQKWRRRKKSETKLTASVPK